MANHLKMTKKQQVLALLELGWTFRRIEAETGVRRETVSRYRPGPVQMRPKCSPAPTGSAGRGGRLSGGAESNAAKAFAGSAANPAKMFPGSRPRPVRGGAYRKTIPEKLAGLSAQRIWQDLVEDFGYGASYESVKRYVRTVAPHVARWACFTAPPARKPKWISSKARRRWTPARAVASAVGVSDDAMPLAARLRRRRLGSEAGNVSPAARARLPRSRRRADGVRHDNLKAAVVRACFYDPDSHEVYLAFAKHWGFTPLPTRPRHPQENGKQERSGGYVKDNALEGRRFDSLEAHNALLRHWNRTVARLRIHGTTRRQVWTHFVEAEQPALRPLAAEPFPFFTAASARCTRTATSRSARLLPGAARAARAAGARPLGRAPRARLSRRDARGRARRVAPGVFAPRPGEAEPRRGSRPTSRGCSGSAPASGPPCSSGPRQRSPRVASARSD